MVERCDFYSAELGEVHQRMMGVIDFDIRGLDLAYALMDGYGATLLIDAVPRGGVPGALYVIEPDLNEPDEPDVRAMTVEAHAMNLMRALGLMKSIGSGRVRSGRSGRIARRGNTRRSAFARRWREPFLRGGW